VAEVQDVLAACFRRAEQAEQGHGRARLRVRASNGRVSIATVYRFGQNMQLYCTQNPTAPYPTTCTSFVRAVDRLVGLSCKCNACAAAIRPLFDCSPPSPRCV